MYILLPPARARITYHGRMPFTAPLACDVIDAAGAIYRAEYVAGSMLDGAARYVVAGVECQIGRDGVLRPVATAEGQAA